MLTPKKRDIILDILIFIDDMKNYEDINNLYFHLYKNLKNLKKKEYNKNINYLDNIILELKKQECDIFIYLKTLWLLPNFKTYNICIIVYWIEKVQVTDKKSKKKTDFLYDIYTYQNEKDFKNKILYLEIILNKIINYIKYSNKNE